MPAKFFEKDVSARLKDKRKLSTYLDTIVKEHCPGVKKIQLQYIFCSDAYLLQINQEFLKHDTLTDIVTFDMSTDDNTMEGEIYISTERVADNANEYSVTYDEELHRVIFHGALHLCGYKDKTTNDKKEMRHQEDICLKQYLKH